MREITENELRRRFFTGSPKCWSCNSPYTLRQRANADGNCPHCGVEIELDDDGASTQGPAIQDAQAKQGDAA